MGRKKQAPDTYGIEEAPELLPSVKKDQKVEKKYIINIEAVEFTDENIGLVIANLRFYKFDARNYDNPGRKPFKIYETSWELGKPIKKKVAEFETVKEQEAAFQEIIRVYANDFKSKYKLTKRKASKKQTGEGDSIPPSPSVSNGPEGIPNSNQEHSVVSESLSPSSGE